MTRSDFIFETFLRGSREKRLKGDDQERSRPAERLWKQLQNEIVRERWQRWIWKIIKLNRQSSRRGTGEVNPTKDQEVAGSIPGLVQWVKHPGVAVSCGVGRRHSSDSQLLWLWCRASSCSSDWPRRLGISMCKASSVFSPKKKKKKEVK